VEYRIGVKQNRWNQACAAHFMSEAAKPPAFKVVRLGGYRYQVQDSRRVIAHISVYRCTEHSQSYQYELSLNGSLSSGYPSVIKAAQAAYEADLNFRTALGEKSQ
jgi:hypothetical protein